MGCLALHAQDVHLPLSLAVKWSSSDSTIYNANGRAAKRIFMPLALDTWPRHGPRKRRQENRLESRRSESNDWFVLKYIKKRKY